MPTPFTEAAADEFDYETDWQELSFDDDRGSSGFADEQQEAVLVGYVPWNKQRSALRFFKGWHRCDTTAPYYLYREQPHMHPRFPWLRAYDVHFHGTVVRSNPANPNGSPWDDSLFDTTGRATKYARAITTVRYRAFGQCRFLDDNEITLPGEEWRRNTIIDPPAATVEALTVSGGLSQLKFAETATGGPTVGTPFTAPLAERQVKLGFRILWMCVPWEYLSADAYFLRPTRILAGLGKVNEQLAFADVNNTTLGFEPETLYFGGLAMKTFPAWRPSTDPADPILFVNVLMDFLFFDPSLGATSPIAHGWNNMPWGGNGIINGDGRYYYCTRDGTATGRPLFERHDFAQLFKNVNDPS